MEKPSDQTPGDKGVNFHERLSRIDINNVRTIHDFVNKEPYDHPENHSDGENHLEQHEEANLEKCKEIKDDSKQKILHDLFNHPNIIQLELDLMKQDSTLDKIDHVAEIIGDKDFKPFISPMLSTAKYQNFYGGQGFLPLDTFVYPLTTISTSIMKGPLEFREEHMFLKGGPRKHLYFEPKKVVAAIVTCGGLCPGLNAVIREVTYTLIVNYGVSKVYGIQYGYRGFYTYNWIELSLSNTNFIQKLGGTILGSSRGGFDGAKIMKKIKAKGVNQLYVIGGDGTQKGAQAIFELAKKENYKLAVVGLPKTIDNDVRIIDRSFGYQTSVDEALKAINSAEVEALSAEYGIGLVKLMGRSAGHIALEACLAHRNIDILLIPEVPFEIYGPNGLLNYVFKRVLQKHHCVIVVAEGASEAVLDNKLESQGKDASGNVKFADIGAFLRSAIVDFCKDKGLDITLKYIDPTYMIRTMPSNAYDTQICAQLSYHAVNGAMVGFTGFCSGTVNNRTAYIPLNLITTGNNRVSPSSTRWQRLLAATGQPSFLNNDEV